MLMTYTHLREATILENVGNWYGMLKKKIGRKNLIHSKEGKCWSQVP